MTNLQKGLAAGAVIVVIGGIIGGSILSRPKAKGEEVYMAKAATKDLASFVSATGRIEARTKVNIQSSVIGEIRELPVKEGSLVKKGDLLVQIDPVRYKAEVDRLDSAVRTGRISIEQAEISLKNAERRYRRNLALRDNSGLVSQEAFEASELDFNSRTIDVRSLKEQLAQAEANLVQARDNLSKTTILAPIDGTVTKLNAEKGEITLTGTMNNPGTVIMIVSDMSEILATVDVDETRVTHVRPDQTARVVVDAVGETKPYTGKVVEIAGSAVQRTGQQTQVFEVKVALDTIDPQLRPGMTAKARIETERADHVIAVPIQAVMLRPPKDFEDGKKEAAATKTAAVRADPSSASAAKPGEKSSETKECVFVVDAGKAHLRPVRSGISDETSVALVEGVKDGDTVVTGPYRALRDLKNGDAVKEKKGDEAKDRSGGGGAKVEVD